MDALIFKAAIFVILFAVGWGFGRHAERKHLKELEAQEKRLAYIRLDSSRFKTSDHLGQLVSSIKTYADQNSQFELKVATEKAQAAITNVEDTIDRSLNDVKCINEKGELKAPLRQAILLMIGSLYDYRGSQQAEQIYDNPAFERLISKYRRMGV